MKTTITIKLLSLAMLLLICFSGINAQDTTKIAIDTTPVVVPAATPADTTAPKPEKTKKDGFNSHNRLGIRVGGVISKQDYDDGGAVAENPEAIIGLDLALLYAIPIKGGFFMIQPELHWMQKGYKINDTALYGDITSTLNYLELPVLLRINLGGSLKLFGFAGPSIGFLLSGTYEDSNGEQDPTDYLDDTEISGHIGIGAGLGTLELDIRYITGLGDISDSEYLDNVKNSSYDIGLSLKF